MAPNLVRLAYMLELLVAWIAYLQLWVQVGGQGHLDLMPWPVKLVLVLGLGLATVIGTAAAVNHEKVWNAKTTASALLGLVLVAGMAFVTYYYHLHENDEVPATEGSPLAVEIRRLAA